MLRENPSYPRQTLETVTKRDIIERQRRFRAFVLDNRHPAQLLEDKHWRERSNPSGVSLLHYLKIKYLQLCRFNQVLEAEVAGAVPAGYSQEQLAEWLCLYDRLYDRYVEDWGIYVQPDGDFFINYIQNQIDFDFENLGPRKTHGDVVAEIFSQRDFSWARFAPMDYAGTEADLLELCSMSLNERAKLRLENRKTFRPNYRRRNHKLIEADYSKLEEIIFLRNPGHRQPVCIDGDYLHDLLRFESLFFVDGDPLPDEFWQDRCLDGPEAVGETIKDARRSLPPFLPTLPI